jgi:hypothetical protein
MIALKVGPDLRMAVVASPAYLATAESIAHPGDLLAHRCLGYRMLGSGALYDWEFERGDEALAIRVSGPFRDQRARADAGGGLGWPRGGVPPRSRGRRLRGKRTPRPVARELDAGLSRVPPLLSITTVDASGSLRLHRGAEEKPSMPHSRSFEVAYSPL